MKKKRKRATGWSRSPRKRHRKARTRVGARKGFNSPALLLNSFLVVCE